MNNLIWAWRSLWFRRSLAAWSMLSIAVSSALMFSLIKLKDAAQSSFEGAVSGVDLIVGARTSELNLVLFSLFRLGQVTNNLSYKAFKDLESLSEVEWAVPLSIGDSLRGFPAVATTPEFFEKYRYGMNSRLELNSGNWFEDIEEVILGAETAEELSLGLGAKVFVSHGLGESSIEEHTDHPFVVAGILKKTGTANDRSVFMSLHAMAMVHRHDHADDHDHQHASEKDIESPVTAVLLKLKNPQAMLHLRNEINQNEEEPMVAAIPSAVLRDFWHSLSFIGKAFEFVGLMVFALSFISLASILLATMEQRRREFVVLRAIGLERWRLLSIFTGEVKILCLLGALIGWAAHFTFFHFAQEWIAQTWGLRITSQGFVASDLLLILVIVALGTVVSLLPFWAIYRRSLASELQSGR